MRFSQYLCVFSGINTRLNTKFQNMKLILTIIFSAFFLSAYAPSEKVSYSIMSHYESIVQYIKDHEGFSSTVYNDNGYQAIGYGVRLLNLSYVPDTVDKKAAEKMLRAVFDKNIQYIEHHYPRLPENKKLALAHLSYCVGIGTVIKYNGILPEKTFGQSINLRNFEKRIWTQLVRKSLLKRF